MSEVQYGDIGTLFKIRIVDQDGDVEDVSTATTKEIIFRRPDGTTLTKTASLTTDGTDGYIEYSSVNGDLDMLGVWELQARIVKGGNDWHGTVKKFRVLRNTD